MILELTNNIIKNSTLRKIIFGTDEVTLDDISDNYISNFNYLFVISFYIIYEASKQKNLSKKVEELIKSVYEARCLSIELVSYLLVEMQVNNEEEFVKGNYETSLFPVAGEIVRNWKKNSLFMYKDIRQLKQIYIYFLENLELLKNINLNDNLECEFNGLKFSLQDYLLVTDDEIYYLYDKDKINNIYHYQSFDGKNTYSVDLNNLNTKEINL